MDDVINSVCGNKNKPENISCEYYEESTRHCILLRQGRIIEIWQNNRCLSYAILNKALQRRFADIKEKFPQLNIDEDFIEDIDYKKIINRIDKAVAKNPLKTPNLAGWIRYLRTTASNYISDYIFPKPRCGACKHLSESDICQLKGLLINKELRENPCYGKKCKRTDPPCKEGYVPGFPEFTSLNGAWHDEKEPEMYEKDLNEFYDEIWQTQKNTESLVIHKSLTYNILNHLKERAEKAEKGTKKKEKFMRQYSVLKKYYKFLQDNPNEQNPNKLFMKENKIGKNKFNRDFKEIREAAKKMIQNAE
ncbi:MAG: hypothetical protein GY749_00480 [Desulfobacteraceae bacterium]|nr:hypothetical protein [Desulfobacteraceae bacterium]